MRNEKLGGERRAISYEAAEVIYRALCEHDSVIEKQARIIENATAEIADAAQKLSRVEQERASLSAQLDMFAPEGFMITEGMALGAPMPPAPPATPQGYVSQGSKPWHKAPRAPRRHTGLHAPSVSMPAPSYPYGDD